MAAPMSVIFATSAINTGSGWLFNEGKSFDRNRSMTWMMQRCSCVMAAIKITAQCLNGPSQLDHGIVCLEEV